jgi:FHA domain-containing protein
MHFGKFATQVVRKNETGSSLLITIGSKRVCFMIEIIAVSYGNEPTTTPLSARFDHRGGSIGRSDDNHFVLPDPKHHVSRLQAMVSSDGERHRITNLSHANPTILNGTELGCDTAHKLQVGDEIRIGTYLLRAQIPANTGDLPSTPQMRRADHSDIEPRPPLTLSQPPLIQSSTSQASSPQASLTQPSLSPALAAMARQAVSTLPRPVQEIPIEDSRSDVATDTSTDNIDPQALMQAFLNGAGIPSITLSSGLTTELMELIGTLLAQTIDGTVDLISMRALIKRELNADVTMVVVRNNNPLKFLPDGSSVLTQMLRKRMPGFMGPVDALRDAFQDLHAHQLGVVAGMQAAVLDVHRQLDPAIVETEEGAPSYVDTVLPAGRKARLWDRYCALHAQTGDAVQTDLQTIAGAAFLTAYEHESKKFKDQVTDER